MILIRWTVDIWPDCSLLCQVAEGEMIEGATKYWLLTLMILPSPVQWSFVTSSLLFVAAQYCTVATRPNTTNCIKMIDFLFWFTVSTITVAPMSRNDRPSLAQVGLAHGVLGPRALGGKSLPVTPVFWPKNNREKSGILIVAELRTLFSTRISIRECSSIMSANFLWFWRTPPVSALSAQALSPPLNALM